MYIAEELVWATQLAYCDFKEEYIKNLNKKGRHIKKKLQKTAQSVQLYPVLSLMFTIYVTIAQLSKLGIHIGATMLTTDII